MGRYSSGSLALCRSWNLRAIFLEIFINRTEEIPLILSNYNRLHECLLQVLSFLENLCCLWRTEPLAFFQVRVTINKK